APALSVALYDLATTQSPPRARTSLPMTGPSGTQAEFAPQSALLLSAALELGSDGAGETALLAFGMRRSGPGLDQQSMALTSVGPRSLHLRGELADSYAALPIGERLYAA